MSSHSFHYESAFIHYVQASNMLARFMTNITMDYFYSKLPVVNYLLHLYLFAYFETVMRINKFYFLNEIVIIIFPLFYKLEIRCKNHILKVIRNSCHF